MEKKRNRTLRNLIFRFSRFQKILRRLSMFLACVVVFVTTYALLLPAITLERSVAEKMPGTPFSNPDGTGENAEKYRYVIVGKTVKDTLTASDGKTYTITVTFDSGVDFPVGAELEVTEIPENSGRYYGEYEEYLKSAESALPVEERVSFARFFDIKIMVDGQEIQPSSPVEVSIVYEQPDDRPETDNIRTVHFEGEEETPVIIKNETSAVSGDPTSGEVTFKTDSFSVFAIVYTTLETTVLASDGNNYKVTVACGSESRIPLDAQLQVSEILPETEAFADYLGKTEDALGLEAGACSYARFFDINILDSNGKKVQPTAGSTIYVDVRLDDLENAGDGTETRVVHFGEEPEVLDTNTSDRNVRFETGGFSVYAIVEAPEMATVDYGWNEIDSLDAIDGRDFYLSHNSYYLKDTYEKVRKSSGTAQRYGLSATLEKYTGETVPDEAALYHFEKDPGEEGKFYISLTKGGTTYYVLLTSINSTQGGLSLTEDADQKTAFTVEPVNNRNRFYIYAKAGGYTYYWNRNNKSEGLGAFVGYSAKTDANTALIRMQYDGGEAPEDPYELNGTTRGIAWYNEEISAVGLTTDGKTVSSQSRLAGKVLLIRPDILDKEGILLTAPGADLAEWTFESVKENQYYLTVTEDGVKKYLTIQGGNVTLQEQPDPEKSVVTVMAGTGEFKGKYHFTVNGYSLNCTGSAESGFNADTGSKALTWMSLVEKSKVLSDDDFTPYTARKVSVSDSLNVSNGSQVIIYTRIWNEDTLRYEFYAIDHDGTLVRVYESGDVLQWTGSKVNTLLWDFTEYNGADGTPSFYYELQNAYSGKYVAPQLKNGQIVADAPIGINLNGRRFGDDYTTIVAWDDPYYEYAGLKTEGNRIVTGAFAEAGDFYFAVMELKVAGALTTVQTVDNNDHGISMKMIDFNNAIRSSRDTKQTEMFGFDSDSKGIVSAELGDDGYPVVTSKTGSVGTSLSALFGDATQANHLFIRNIYNESGYFEYDSTQNFARLNEDGNFTVYDQLAAIGNETRVTRTHGQFMPYNDIREGVIALVTNQTDVHGQPLSDLDPRKGEALYMIEPAQADYFFGMEMEASFTQTESGLDAWGHDIIFEFSGDDDFWLYVDGELVLDLGGVHSAMTGSVNFRTGAINTSKRGNTTLYEVFRDNYRTGHPDAADEEVNAYLNGIFHKNENGQYVFNDYTTHTMKIFYMERGAGASNLHMRFNLTSVKPGTVVLSKKITGTQESDYTLAEFPYQIYYRTESSEDFALLDEMGADGYNVTYKGKQTPVRFAEQFTPAGGQKSYNKVFFLKPGQSAEIHMPEGTAEYYISECGVNPTIYRTVKANETVLTGADADEDGRADFDTSRESLEKRPKVEYENEVDPDAMRTLKITKKLFGEDGVTPVHHTDDSTVFSFRLYLGGENDPEPSVADMHSYYVRDDENNYCRWDSGSESFVSLDKKEYSQMTEEERRSATFTTSMNGAISKIPVDYTVEVRELVIGTKFCVEERDNEIPVGYARIGYFREDGSYVVEEGDEANAGTIRASQDPAVQVHNQRGWGLTVKKVWSDNGYMASHDDIYLALFWKNSDGSLTLLDGTVRQLTSNDSTASVYWYFESLDGMTFDQVVAREVTISEGAPDVENGVVKNPGEVTMIEEGGSLTIDARPAGEEQAAPYTYSVHYSPGEASGAAKDVSNVRTDTVSNTREGIAVLKMDSAGSPLAGAAFTILDEAGNIVGEDIYLSDENGFVTMAYIPDGTYTLTETKAPAGYRGLSEPLTFRVAGTRITLDGSEEILSLCYVGKYTAQDGEMPAITVKNMPAILKAVKKGENDAPLEGVQFALYRQVKNTEGNLVRDYLPITGYEDLVTDIDGVLPKITQELPAGTYYLTEQKALEGYTLPEGDLCFTIHESGDVTIEEDARWSLIYHTLQSENEKGVPLKTKEYTIRINNIKGAKKIQIKKVDIENPTKSVLSGAKFDLYKVEDDGSGTTLLYTGMTSGSDGMLQIPSGGASGDTGSPDGVGSAAAAGISGGTSSSGNAGSSQSTGLADSPAGGQTEVSVDNILEIGQGIYQLVETEAPTGYDPKVQPVVITVTASDVTYDEGTNLSLNGDGISYDAETGIFTLLVSNTAGFELPNTGGPGTGIFRIAGVLLILAAAALLRTFRIRYF